MKAKVKEIISLELEESFEAYFPTDPHNFGTWVRMMIGPENENGADSFDILICTLTWLDNEYPERKMFWGKNMLIVHEFNSREIISYINKYIDNFYASDWQSLALKLCSVGIWEFENYNKYK